MPVEYGIGGYDPSKPNNNVVRSTPDAVDPTLTNGAAVRAKAKAYLDLPTTTTAQDKKAIRAIIHLLLNLLDDVSDT